MTTLENRIARLEAESEIRRLKARYLNACDTKDPVAIRACFTVDAVLDYAPMGQFSVNQLIEVFTELAVKTPIADSHQAHNAEIIIQDDGRALGRWSLGFVTLDPVSKTFRLMHGMYEDEYALTPQGWRIAASRHTPRLIADGALVEGTLKITDLKAV